MGIRVSGKVCGGNKIGRLLGYPTANIVVSEEMKAGNGAYAAHVEVAGKWYDAMAYLGYKPSVGGSSKRMLEANIFDFEADIYDMEITIELLDFIREERKFDSFELLKAQLACDKAECEKLLR